MTDSPEPSRLDKLRAVETYLRWQLEKIQASIAAEEARRAAAQPATAWCLQHLPGGKGKTGRGMLHREGCVFAMGKVQEMGREGAALALGEDYIEVCDVCKPEVGLRAAEHPTS